MQKTELARKASVFFWGGEGKGGWVKMRLVGWLEGDDER